MSTEGHTVQALQAEIAELKSRVEELSFQNAALRNLCVAKGIGYGEALAAERHRRYF